MLVKKRESTRRRQTVCLKLVTKYHRLAIRGHQRAAEMVWEVFTLKPFYSILLVYPLIAQHSLSFGLTA
jgi:hypothetical protein